MYNKITKSKHSLVICPLSTEGGSYHWGVFLCLYSTKTTITIEMVLQIDEKRDKIGVIKVVIQTVVRNGIKYDGKYRF